MGDYRDPGRWRGCRKGSEGPVLWLEAKAWAEQAQTGRSVAWPGWSPVSGSVIKLLCFKGGPPEAVRIPASCPFAFDPSTTWYPSELFLFLLLFFHEGGNYRLLTVCFQRPYLSDHFLALRGSNPLAGPASSTDKQLELFFGHSVSNWGSFLTNLNPIPLCYLPSAT